MELITEWTELKINEAVKLHYARKTLMFAEAPTAVTALYWRTRTPAESLLGNDTGWRWRRRWRSTSLHWNI